MRKTDSGRSRFAVAATLSVIAASIAAISCQTAAPVRVEGSPKTLAAVAGTWEGEYSGGPKGRSGKIRFTFAPEGQEARGEVWMMPAGEKGQGETAAPKGEATVPSSPRLLRIQVVEVSDRRVKGRLEPYWDPNCDCEAKTTFEGRIEGDVIEGSFFASTSNTPAGRWRVSRSR